MTPQLPKRIERINYLLLAALAAIGAVLLSPPHALGLTVGAAISALQFSGLRWLVDRMRTLPEPRRKGVAALLLPHLLATMGAVILALVYLPLSGGALLIGFSIFFVSIIAGTILDTLSAPDEETSTDESSS